MIFGGSEMEEGYGFGFVFVPALALVKYRTQTWQALQGAWVAQYISCGLLMSEMVDVRVRLNASTDHGMLSIHN